MMMNLPLAAHHSPLPASIKSAAQLLGECRGVHLCFLHTELNDNTTYGRSDELDCSLARQRKRYKTGLTH